MRDSAEASWLGSDRRDLETAGTARERVVIVEMPDEIAQRYEHFVDVIRYLSNYLIPWEVVNAYRPFRYERLL